MQVNISSLKGFNNCLLVEMMVPPTGERRSKGGVIIPENVDKPVHVFSKVLHCGWSCSGRIKVGDFIVAEKAFNLTLINPDTGRKLQVVHENDIVGHVLAEDVDEVEL